MSAETIDSKSLDTGGGRVLARALRNATSDIKGITGLFLALGGAVASYIALKKSLPGPTYFPDASVAAFFVAFYFLYVHPEWREERKRHRLNVQGIRGQIVDPSYFRLSPYEADDREHFMRPDGAGKAALKWVTNTTAPLLYLSGQSGVGKSSLLNAAIAPSLAASHWVVVTARPHENLFAGIASNLLKSAAIWQTPPNERAELKDLLNRAAESVQSKGQRLLLIVDQFEEALILGDENARTELGRFLLNLVKEPIRGLVVLLSVRAEYLNDLVDLGLPAPNFGDNAFEVRPFTRAAAQTFIEASKIDPGPRLLDQVLNEAAEIEDMPDKVRPIIINMFGLVIASFKGELPRNVEPGRLLSGYVERSLNRPALRGIATKVLRPLVTDVGTKRALAIDAIAGAAGVTPTIARGCLIELSKDGLVRALDKQGGRWEIAHDFIARLLQPALRTWRTSAWDTARRWIAPASLSIWLLAAVAAIVFLPTLREMVSLGELRSVGLVPGAYDAQGRVTFVHTGDAIKDQARLWQIARILNELPYPVAGLAIHGGDLTSLQGMPTLPELSTLNLSETGLRTLQGLPSLPVLDTLMLNYSRLKSLQGMPLLPALSTLALLRTELRNLQGLQSLPALTVLNLSYNVLTNLEGMRALPALTTLYLSYTQLGSLQGMPALPALTRLYLDHGYIENLQGMPALPALYSLDLRFSHIKSLEGMRVLPALTMLDLSDSDLASLGGMQVLPALTNLAIGSTHLEGLQGMPTLPALTELSLFADTHLTSLDALPELPRLEMIDIRGLKLNTFDKLKSLPKLRKILANPEQLQAIPIELRPKAELIK